MSATLTKIRPVVVAAIVVTYQPDIHSFQRLLSILREAGVYTIVVDNGGGSAAMPEVVDDWGVKLVDLGANRGIGAAINVGLAEARKLGATYVVTFDQDSQPALDMVKVLASEFDRQLRQGTKIGAVGPRFIDRRHNPPLEHPFIRLKVFGSGHRYCANEGEVISVDTLITSGCLISLDVLFDVGDMDQNYFVDYTDIEWSFRAKSKGYVLLGVCSAQMNHELGGGVVRSVFGLNLFEYSPKRRYYYARNTIAVARLDYVPLRWKVRLLVGLILRLITVPLAPRRNGQTFWLEGRMMLRGIVDGSRGVRGALDSSISSRASDAQ